MSPSCEHHLAHSLGPRRHGAPGRQARGTGCEGGAAGPPLASSAGARVGAVSCHRARTVFESADDGLVPTPLTATTRNRYLPAGRVIWRDLTPGPTLTETVRPVATPLMLTCTAVTR